MSTALPPPQPDAQDDELAGTEQPFVAHLLELRDRLLASIYGVIVAIVALAIFPGPARLMDLVAAPIRAHMPPDAKLIATGVLSPFVVPLKVLAIAALLLGRYFGWVWTDPAMGLVGSVVILRWSWGLMRDTARVLLDATPEAEHIRSEVREALAGDGTLTDLHVWQVGPSHFAAIVALRSHTLQSPDAVKAKLAHVHELSHLTVEIQRA